MSNLCVFQFESQDIRFVDGKPVANDVAQTLGYADPAATVSKKVFRENKGVAKIETPGGVQSITVLEEAGIYQLIFSSKLPSAQKFQQWVFSEVLPSIRKTGSYAIAPKIPQTYAEALFEAAKLAMENEKLAAQIEKDAPMVNYAQAVQYSEDCVDIGEFAKIISNSGKVIGRNTLIQKMRDCGVLMQKSTEPYQQWVKAGYLKLGQEVKDNGQIYPFTLITGKGQLWLHQRLNHYDAMNKKVIDSISQGVLRFSGI